MTLQTDDNPYTAYIQKHMPMRKKMMLQMHIISCYILIPKNEILFLSNKLCHATTAATDAIVVVVWYKNVKWFVVEGCKLVEQG